MLSIFRHIILFTYLGIGFFFFTIVCLVRPFDSGNVWLVCRYMIKHTLWLMGVSHEYQGLENFKSNGSVILSNHQNNYDIMYCSNILPKKTVSLGKTSILYIPIFGMFYWLSGNLLINRTNRRKAKKSMEIATQKIKSDGLNVWIMPEGTRARGKDVLLPFKRGAFVTAINAGVPIVPVCFSTYHKKIDFNKVKSGKVLTTVLPAIETTGLGVEDSNELMNKTYSLMKTEIEKLNHLLESKG